MRGLRLRAVRRRRGTSSWRWCLIGEKAQQPWTPGGQPIDLLTACARIQTDCHLISNPSQDTPNTASVLPPLQGRYRIVVVGYGERVYAHADTALVRLLAPVGDVIATCHRLWSTGSVTGTYPFARVSDSRRRQVGKHKHRGQAHSGISPCLPMVYLSPIFACSSWRP